MHYTIENTIRADVSLNGEAITDVIEADTAAGYVIRYKRNTDGDYIVTDDELETERLEGEVRVTTRFG